MLLPSLTIFTSAFLLFLVQPMMGKFILPWFGGVPSVWTTCMLFFQAGLLFGYGYAHWMIERLSSRQRLLVHSALVVTSGSLLLLGAGQALRPSQDEAPTVFILLYLAATIGLPYFTISATSPLIQGVLGRDTDTQGVYRLYSLSNIGSLLALFLFPLVFEQFVTRSSQLSFWVVGYLLYGLFVCLFLLRETDSGAKPEHTEESAPTELPAALQLKWLFLSGTGCAILLAGTNRICQDISSIPFLWIVPLALYLISFIICFAEEIAPRTAVYVSAFFVSVGMLFLLEQSGLPKASLLLSSVVVLMFSAFMICHGELAREKPVTQHLTRYYLLMSLGSVLGSLFVSLGAPIVFLSYSEFVLSLCFTGIIAVSGYLTRLSLFQSSRARYAFLWGGVALSFIVTFCVDRNRATLITARNFFGVLKVQERQPDSKEYHRRVLEHGKVTHGLQFMHSAKRMWPTAYYGKDSGAGLLLQGYLREQPRNIGAIGLGVGTIAIYGKPDDTFRHYEINPLVQELAEEYFTFLKDSQSKQYFVIGDGRYELSKEAPQNFDILILDAFSGDAIPVHLLTEEAFREYLRHLSPQGLIAVHVTNHYLDLVPVVVSAANQIGLEALYVQSRANKIEGRQASTYMVIAREEVIEAVRAILPGSPKIQLTPEQQKLWTDDFSSLLGVIKW